MAAAGMATADGPIRDTFDRSGVTAKIPDSIDNAYMQSVQDALMSRLQPTQDRDQSQLRRRLLNSGIEVGTDAYNREMALQGQKQNDARMQAVIADRFSACTVIVIAHRLHTLTNSDRILCMDAGQLVAHASPAELLCDANSVFAKLVDETGDAATLRARIMAGAR